MSGSDGRGGGGALTTGTVTTGTAAIAQQAGILPRTGSSVAILATVSILCGVAVFLSQLYTAYKKRA